jgi:hypothetical protein
VSVGRIKEGELHRYWIEFGRGGRWPEGCGVTAFDREDAFDLIEEQVLRPYGLPMPPVIDVTEDVDVSVILERYPNVAQFAHLMNPPNWRGVWWPAPRPLR